MTTPRVRAGVGAAALAVSAALLAGGAGAVAPVAYAAPSPAASPSGPAPRSGLYGTKDPAYDGVWRQSLAFIAQQTAGVKPAERAVDWLLGQQCGNGAFPPYHARPDLSCTPRTVLDTNATAVAVQALARTDKPETENGGTDPVTAAVRAGVGWLKGVQNTDGGWGYNPGGPSDANSTSIVISALAAAGERPGEVRSGTGHASASPSASGTTSPSASASTSTSAGPSTGSPSAASASASPSGPASVSASGAAESASPPASPSGTGADTGTEGEAAGRTPYDALLGFAIPCGATAGGGAFAYQPDPQGALVANADATAAATLAGLGKHYRSGGVAPDQPVSCETPARPTIERAARNGAAYLAAALAKTGHLDLPPMPGAATTTPQPDFGNTADAVVALGAAGHRDKAAKAVTWLKENSAAWAKESGPAAYAQLIFAAHTMGEDPRDFGGNDLVEQLNATGPAPVEDSGKPSAKPSRDGGDGSDAKDDKDAKDTAAGEESGLSVWLVVAIFLVAGIGIGFLLSGRNRNGTS
ncbi:terpene cyclase/mutase family protein [Streptomyces sp. LP05-1]|uniref:Terpene cyclase/mutase family protein n=1 Tax=Streptomyces pyxinae TaxID=2970734 RepID=A0ABT2CP61_9ACTN|nr:prenyltransferase/squalene oxidase repeat-containing protein [Streptomyces sp. LP05-1]MCS0639232.1 terpene cyclase/mutase family protein [Streptomyces sp. LP05-1]